MGRKIILVLFIAIALAAGISYSFSTNSSNYKNFPLIVSSGGDTVNGSSYKTYTATGIIAGITNSSTYKNLLGFFYTWLLADGEACTSADQCEGGFCCSNVCQSTSCPSGAAEEAAGGGGAAAAAGGGGAIVTEIITESDFSASPGSVKVKLVLGESSEETLTISNIGDTDLTVSLIIEGVQNYLFLSANILSIGAGQSADIALNFIGKDVGSFTGRIVARADGIEKEIPIIIETITKKILFDAKLDIPTAYAVVEPGGTLKSQITLLNVGAPEKVDVFLTYLIKDLRGNIIYEESETFAVEKQVSFTKSFRIPDNLETGSYVAIIEVRYADSFAVSSQLFNVEEIVAGSTRTMLILVFVLAIFMLLFAYKFLPKGRKGK